MKLNQENLIKLKWVTTYNYKRNVKEVKVIDIGRSRIKKFTLEGHYVKKKTLGPICKKISYNFFKF